MQQSRFPLHQVIDADRLQSVEIFTRISPPCPFCAEARKWIKENIPNVKIIEYDMRRDTEKWRELYAQHPEARIPPQIAITMQNGARRHIGGYQELLRAFSLSVQQEA